MSGDDKDLRDFAHALGCDAQEMWSANRHALAAGDPGVVDDLRADMNALFSEARRDPRAVLARHDAKLAAILPGGGGAASSSTSTTTSPARASSPPPAPGRKLPDAAAIYRARAEACARHAAADAGGATPASTTATAPAAPRGLPDPGDVYARRAARMGGG